jgi:hypothetical protein
VTRVRRRSLCRTSAFLSRQRDTLPRCAAPWRRADLSRIMPKGLTHIVTHEAAPGDPQLGQDSTRVHGLLRDDGVRGVVAPVLRHLADQKTAGAVQPRRDISRCTDRSAGGCAGRLAAVTAPTQALCCWDAAEAPPRRCASWRSRGRWWRGPAAHATERLCRLSAVPAGPLVRGAIWGPWNTAQARATNGRPPALCQRLTAPGEGSPMPLPGQITAFIAAPG